MPTRVLDWNGLVRVAQRRDPVDRIVAIGGIPARVVPHLATDAGFYVRTLDEERQDTYWSLRKAGDLVLLRALVDAGLVTVDDDEDVWRTAEWDALLRDTSRGCFIAGCTAGPDDIDIRGPVFDDRHRMHKACTPHWEGLMGTLGGQHPAGSVDLDEGNH
jgi:hypothetical protein